MTANRIAVITGAGYSKAGGWPDTSAILDDGAWAVTRDKAARYHAVWDAYAAWKAGAANPSGDVFMAEVAAGRVRGVTWPMVVEVAQATLASPGMNASWRVSPRYGDSLMQPSKVASHGNFFAGVLSAGETNVVVMADEAHRTQYGLIDGHAAHMRTALNSSQTGPFRLRWW